MKIFIYIFILLFNLNAFASTKSYMLPVLNSGEECSLRVVESIPDTIKIKSDLLFFIGFGDRADNHGPLFKKLNEVGIRVISFDYPSHGLSNCGSINENNYTDLMNFANTVEEKTRQDITRPLILSGWSTGGLLALRLLQTGKMIAREIQSLILIAPGISVYPLVGGDGIIRNESLLSNLKPPHIDEPKPVSPLLTPIFSSTLIYNGLLARKTGLSDVPTLIFIGGEKNFSRGKLVGDSYAKSSVLKEFVTTQKEKGTNVKSVVCPLSKHEMDNEIEEIGSIVRLNFALFANDSKSILKVNQSCHLF
jgi:alpha-beta hydrolase superfamily lysophospholipase